MAIPGGKKTKTGYSTSADILEKLASENLIINDILEYRQLTKLKSTYADGLGNVIGEDGRIHSTFNQTITATGRISSTDPNLQNIPVRMELGRLIRKVFVPEEGFVFLDADYSQIELRVLAHMSGDEKMIGNQYVEQGKCIVDATRLVRRLIPLECERLMGFPDYWTDIPKASDSARYRALGNSVAVPCVDFILCGIAYFLRKMGEEEEDVYLSR